MYVSNPFIPKVRRIAVNDVLVRGLTQEEAALKYGVVKSTICKWIKKSQNFYQNEYIDTYPSRPHHHPNELSSDVVKRIIEVRKSVKRCAPIIHAHLIKEGINVSLSSVGRVLKRNHLVRKKRAYFKLPAISPVSNAPGSLVEADTIHFARRDHSRFYVYSVLDTYTRLAYAEYHRHITPEVSLQVVANAGELFGFPLRVIQTDHGEEFSQSFYFALKRQNIPLRYIRTRKPNDNAHIERFNRTLQEECFSGQTPSERLISRRLAEYLVYYNEERLHLSLNCLTPREFVSKVLK
ncbi:integrase core domain-containing protein [Patescibacteria group bacterium]|nr:integrase core domain-containing protein [Patescibacteria group bacterium]MCL5091932.1 integrase core domain-containing protein [Patescibacteria group bacterium]